MSNLYKDFCIIFPGDPLRKPQNDFSFKIFLWHKFVPPGFDEHDSVHTLQSRRMFEVERDRLINNDASKSTIEAMLSTMSIPVKASLVDEILIYVKEMTDDNLYTSLDINMGFFVDTPVEILPRDYGVTDPSVLEIVKVEASKEPSICVICLEEVVFGSLGTRMPCSHVFHSDCIGNWLNERQVCPLCRFRLK
ncbi:E3 ubiquitin-protein ligase Praja-1-like [Pistacia vera]|uniref:E3 ubiquitin-protein ligase Praja-1-like n=1 Tax=Pistacia vera TaxID=55513 RepID=UPI001262DE5E|nr:E3 ubiquitin-protein ligase Praja-1-like [Pistacia vera]